MPLPQQAGADLVCFSCDRGAKGLGGVPLSIDALETSIVNGWSTGISKYDYGLLWFMLFKGVVVALILERLIIH